MPVQEYQYLILLDSVDEDYDDLSQEDTNNNLVQKDKEQADTNHHPTADHTDTNDVSNTSHDHQDDHHGVSLASWRWAGFGKTFLFTLMLLLGCLIKVSENLITESFYYLYDIVDELSLHSCLVSLPPRVLFPHPAWYSPGHCGLVC